MGWILAKMAETGLALPIPVICLIKYSYYQPISHQCSICIPPEKVIKPLVFWRFQGVYKWNMTGWEKWSFFFTSLYNSSKTSSASKAFFELDFLLRFGLWANGSNKEYNHDFCFAFILLEVFSQFFSQLSPCSKEPNSIHKFIKFYSQQKTSNLFFSQNKHKIFGWN